MRLYVAAGVQREAARRASRELLLPEDAERAVEAAEARPKRGEVSASDCEGNL